MEQRTPTSGPVSNEIEGQIQQVRRSIRDCEMRFGREPDSVKLIAVSKRQPITAIRDAIVGGQYAFGENYLSEAKPKITATPDLNIEWHYIGAIQSNKTAEVAALFDWVHTVDRPKIAQRLNTQRNPALPPLNVCIQVNIGGEPTKLGVTPPDLPMLIDTISGLPQLALRGLMALPAPDPDFTQQRKAFALLRELALSHSVDLDHLSMGTSNDYSAAIAEGSTMVRIGTAIFGPRS